MAKRQREKPSKIEQRKVWGPERGSRVKQTALLASPIYIRKAQGEEKKTYKKRNQNWTRGLSSHLLGWHALMPQRGTFLCLPNKSLSCNQAVTVVCHFKSLLWWDRTEEITHFPYIFMHQTLPLGSTFHKTLSISVPITLFSHPETATCKSYLLPFPS